MSRLARLSLAAGAALAAVASLGVQAGGSDPSGAAGRVSTAVLSTPHKLLKSYFETDAPGSAVAAATFVPVGSVLSFNCANTAGCTVAGNMNAQFAAVASDNNVAICLQVDGGFVNCPFNALIRPGSGFQVANYQTFTSVALGNHTMQMFVYANVATTLHRYNKEFKLYKP